MTVFQAILEKIKTMTLLLFHRRQKTTDPDAIGSQVRTEILKQTFR